MTLEDQEQWTATVSAGDPSPESQLGQRSFLLQYVALPSETVTLSVDSLTNKDIWLSADTQPHTLPFKGQNTSKKALTCVPIDGVHKRKATPSTESTVVGLG